MSCIKNQIRDSEQQYFSLDDLHFFIHQFSPNAIVTNKQVVLTVDLIVWYMALYKKYMLFSRYDAYRSYGVPQDFFAR